MQCACAILSFLACPALQYFSTLCHKQHDFRKESYRTQNVCFDFLYKFVWNISHSKKNWERFDQKCISVFMYSTGYYCQIVMKIEFFRKIFEKCSNIKLHENPSGGSRVDTCGQTDGRTDGHDEGDSRFWQFCKCA